LLSGVDVEKGAEEEPYRVAVSAGSGLSREGLDKSLRLGLTAGLRVFVCSNMAFSGDLTPVLG
jgi:hypothetical protein